MYGVTEERLAGEFRRVFGRPAQVVAWYEDRRFPEAAEAAVVVEGWPEPIRYSAAMAVRELRRCRDGEGESEYGDAQVCRQLEKAGALRGRGYRTLRVSREALGLYAGGDLTEEQAQRLVRLLTEHSSRYVVRLVPGFDDGIPLDIDENTWLRCLRQACESGKGHADA